MKEILFVFYRRTCLLSSKVSHSSTVLCFSFMMINSEKSVKRNSTLTHYALVAVTETKFYNNLISCTEKSDCVLDVICNPKPTDSNHCPNPGQKQFDPLICSYTGLIPSVL